MEMIDAEMLTFFTLPLASLPLHRTTTVDLLIHNDASQ